jgi:molecular chaperone GrpE
MDEATREALVAQFRAYLDGMAERRDAEHEFADDNALADAGVTDQDGPESGPESGPEDGPAGGPEEAPAPDLFSFHAELAAVKNEVKLQSRQFKTALEEFRGLFDNLHDSNARLHEEQERRFEQSRAADRAAARDMLLELLDLRDRLHAGQQQAERFQPRWYARNRREVGLIASLAEGMAMNLRRLDETLARRGVRPIPTEGRTFDPHRMRAAEVTRDPEYRNGEVMDELRPGWLLHDELLRLAEVVVNRVDTPDDYFTQRTES